jgi:aspartyl-tRNA(Asn)/glutamyl-tRNA(Gln) amidotransferase subunit B
MRYADVSDANLFYGNMRFDVNVSVSKTDKLGIRSETKNLNSFKAVEKAVEYEVNRQIELLEKGKKVIQETRGWDDSKQKTFSQRTKEEAEDYRYMPDPDIPPIVIEQSYIAKVKKEMPVMPDEWRRRLEDLELDNAQIETLLDAQADDTKQDYLGIIENNIADKVLAKQVASWIINIELPMKAEGRISSSVDKKIRQATYKSAFDFISSKKMNSNQVATFMQKIFSSGNLPSDIEGFAQDEGLLQVSDEGEVAKIVKQVIKDNPKAVEDVKGGEMKAIGFLVGQVMKASKGKANPSLAQELIKKQLGI